MSILRRSLAFARCVRGRAPYRGRGAGVEAQTVANVHLANSRADHRAGDQQIDLPNSDIPAVKKAARGNPPDSRR